MKAFAIATNDVRIQGGFMTLRVKSADKTSTETTPACQDASFADILNRKKGIASKAAPPFNKRKPQANDPNITAGPTGKPVAADTSPKSKQTKGFTVLSPSGDHEMTQGDSQKPPVAMGIDDMSFPAFTDTVFTKTPNPATSATDIALDLQEGAFASTPAITEGESPIVQPLPNAQISLPPGKTGLEIPLQGAIKPDNRIFSETRTPEDHAPTANNIPSEEAAFPLKATGPDQMLKTRFTSTFAMTEKADAANMNPLTLQKAGPAMPGRGEDSEQTLRPPITSASLKTENTEAAIMNPPAVQKGAPAIPDNAADPERATEAGLETESTDEDRMARHHSIKNARHQVESKFTDRVTHLLLQKEGSPPSENILPPVRRTAADTRNDHPSALTPKDAASSAASRNPAAMANSERDLASRPVFLDRAESTVELHDGAVSMNEGGATASGHDANIDKNRHLIFVRTANPAECEPLPFRTDSLSTPPLTESKAPLSENQAGSRTQAIINQIIDAKQAMNGDFGRIRIVLSPPNLGTVDLEIVVRNERVAVVMTADNSSVQQALQSRADDIRNALQRHDLKIEAFQVFLQDQEANRQNQSHGGALFEQRRDNQATGNFKESDAAPLSSPIPAVSFIQGSGPQRGRVSIFV